jgi:hypothetical protein
MAKKAKIKVRNFWYRKPRTQVVSNQKRQYQKYACRQSRNPLQAY